MIPRRIRHPSEPSISLAAQAEAELSQNKIWLSFPPALESRYKLDRAEERSREQRTFFRISLLLYVAIGVIMKLAGVTHISWSGYLFQMAGATAAVSLLIYYVLKTTMSDVVRETASLACCLIVSLAAILVTYSKPATLQDLIIAALPANYVLMFMRLRFPFAFIFALVTFASYATSVLLRLTLTPSEQTFLVTFMAIICLPALVGVHSLEKASRRVYLHGLLQHLRLKQMAAENSTLSKLSMTDPLTQTANRRRLDEELSAFFAAGRLRGALLLIDVDRFKSFNDKYGHQAGDMCLQQVARCLASHLRRRDLLARFGGEEFAVLLSNVTTSEAVSMAERLRTAVEVYPIEIKGERFNVTVSIGVAVSDMHGIPRTLIESADVALYAAKNAGRNQISFSSEKRFGQTGFFD